MEQAPHHERGRTAYARIPRAAPLGSTQGFVVPRPAEAAIQVPERAIMSAAPSS